MADPEEEDAKLLPIQHIVRLDVDEVKTPLRKIFASNTHYSVPLDIWTAHIDDDGRFETVSHTYMFCSAEDRSRLVQFVRAHLSCGSFHPVVKPPVQSPFASSSESKVNSEESATDTSTQIGSGELSPSQMSRSPKSAVRAPTVLLQAGDVAARAVTSCIKALPKEEWTAEFDHVTFIHQDVQAGDLHKLVHGLFHVSNYRLCFLMYAWPLNESGAQLQGFEAVLRNGKISAVVEIPLETVHEVSLNAGQVRFMTDDLRTLTFICDFSSAQIKGMRDLILERKKAVRGSFTYHQGVSQDVSWEKWACWSPLTELESFNTALRKAAIHHAVSAEDCIQLSLYDQGEKFSLCKSYPRQLVVPASFTKESIEKIASFRSRGRIPVVRWVHPRTGAVLCRSSQPMVGITNNRCSEDEHLLEVLCKPCQKQQLFIVDARGRPAVLGNTLQGRGLERASAYQGATIQLCQIGNIHTMRTSVLELASSFSAADDSNFWEKVENSRWLAHLTGIMAASNYVARRLHDGDGTVLVHCSDGFDRTPQLICMVKLILDPRSRTLDGFCRLVATEWCGFGHKFAQRCKLECGNEYSPIFVQFLDAVHNLLRYSPQAFEFNESLLVFLAEHTYSARFGNFLHDSEADRADDKVVERTASIWMAILFDPSLQGRFTNTNFTALEMPVWPPLATKSLIPFFAFFDNR